MGATTVNSEPVRSGQGALKEPGGIVFREGSHTPRFRAWDSGQQGSRLHEEGVRGLVAQQIQTWSQNVMANILRTATKSDMVPIERPGMSEWMFGSPYNGGQFVRRYAARGTGRRSARGLRRRLLHAGEAGVDALDRGVGLVDVHIDDEFELIVVGHGANPLARTFALRTMIVRLLII